MEAVRSDVRLLGAGFSRAVSDTIPSPTNLADWPSRKSGSKATLGCQIARSTEPHLRGWLRAVH
jgi:hypothetical protein